MGTDIHFVTQKKVDGKWVDFESDIAGDRIYFWFAWLADVRNGHGFAGVKTHKPVIPLTSKRGLPDDFTLDPERGTYADHHNGTWMGDHSYGWAMSSEILNHYRPSVDRTGLVSAQTYVDFRDKGVAPKEWCGDVWGPNTRILSPEDFDREYGLGVVPTDHLLYVRLDWTDEFPIGWFIREVEATVYKHGEFRMVFGFDS